MVLAWSYPGLAPFLVKTGPGVDTIIKQTTTTPPPPHHKLFLGSSLFEPVFRQVLMKPRNFFSYLHVFTENDSWKCPYVQNNFHIDHNQIFLQWWIINLDFSSILSFSLGGCQYTTLKTNKPFVYLKVFCCSLGIWYLNSDTK